MWIKVAETSTTHPSRLPGIEDIFEDAGHGPLPVADIERLIERLPHNEPYVATGVFAKEAGISQKVLRSRINKAGLTPAFSRGTLHIYHRRTLEQLMDAEHA